MDTFSQICVAVFVVIVTCLIALKVYVERIKGWCHSAADLTGKTVVVTGANTGIGFWAAKDLAKRNACVILACRNMDKAKTAVDKIIKETGNKNVVARHLDLSLMKSVRSFVEEFKREESRLDILINNAGIAERAKTLTEEGFETAMASNYFGHFLLTNLLLDMLKKCTPSRVVNVSSIAHGWCRKINLDTDDLKQATTIRKAQLYMVSKLCNILFTRELARRVAGTGVTAYSLHPGTIKTELFRQLPTITRYLIGILLYFYLKTPEEGAQTSIYCAVSEELEGVSGRYYMDCKDADDQSSVDSKDMELARKLWEYSARVTGLSDS